MCVKASITRHTFTITGFTCTHKTTEIVMVTYFRKYSHVFVID